MHWLSPSTAAGEKITISYRYCSNYLDLSKDTFAEAIKKGRYERSECWVNSLYDFYGDRLLDPNRPARYRITREEILGILGRTEENIKDGLTIQQVVPFFEKFKLKLRVYDVFYKLVFKYDPPVDHRNNPPMYCMCHEGHIYTLNDRLDSLAHRGQDEEEEEREATLVRVGTDYRVQEYKGHKHAMIETVDDILELLKACPEPAKGEKPEAIYMIQKQDDLEHILWEMRERGHTPTAKFEKSGRLSMIMDTFNKIKFHH